jgi:DNA-binding PadR family transcriptional regulator
MRTEELKLIILDLLKDKEFYGYEIHKLLEAEGIRVEFGSLYRLLIRLQNDGFLLSRWQESGKGPMKRIYNVSKKGIQELDATLSEAIDTVNKYYDEYLMKVPVEKSVFNMIAKLATSDLKNESVVAYVSTQSSPLNEKTLNSVVNNVPRLKTFIVKPNSVDRSLHPENIAFLEGWNNSIPLKDEQVDLLFLTSLPRNENLREATKEWCRVIRKNGRLAILAPTVIFQNLNDPLNIGDFIEKWIYTHNQNNEALNYDFFWSVLEKSFRRIEVKQIIHMTLLLASERY